MLPDFQGRFLPPGVHVASWSEVNERFGWNERRRVLLGGLRRCLDELSRVGCQRAWLDGSFVSKKEHPGDFDLVWDPTGVALDEIDSVLLDLDPPRLAQKMTYGGDLLPNVIEGVSGKPFLDFFQEDDVTGMAKGIVQLDPGDRS